MCFNIEKGFEKQIALGNIEAWKYMILLLFKDKTYQLITPYQQVVLEFNTRYTCEKLYEFDLNHSNKERIIEEGLHLYSSMPLYSMHKELNSMSDCIMRMGIAIPALIIADAEYYFNPYDREYVCNKYELAMEFYSSSRNIKEDNTPCLIKRTRCFYTDNKIAFKLNRITYISKEITNDQ